MLGSRNFRDSIQMIDHAGPWSLCLFAVAKAFNTAHAFVQTMEKSLRLIPHYVRTRPKDFLNCSVIYVAVAILVELMQGQIPSQRILVTSALVGGLISPFVIPWVRDFPLTGSPKLPGVKRLIDFLFNVFAHFLSLTIFVWILKALVSLTGRQLFDLPWHLTGFFEAGLAFVLVNNLRKVATEYFGIKYLVLLHPQGRDEIARAAAIHPEFTEEQHRLLAWNYFREIGNGYAFWRSTPQKPIGVQYWIAISKMLDSVAILF